MKLWICEDDWYWHVISSNRIYLFQLDSSMMVKCKNKTKQKKPNKTTTTTPKTKPNCSLDLQSKHVHLPHFLSPYFTSATLLYRVGQFLFPRSVFISVRTVGREQRDKSVATWFVTSVGLERVSWWEKNKVAISKVLSSVHVQTNFCLLQNPKSLFYHAAFVHSTTFWQNPSRLFPKVVEALGLCYSVE